MNRLLPVVIVAIASGLFWQLVCHMGGVTEPWDAAGYWSIWYPASIVLAALAGALFIRRAWLAGVIVTFAQMPVMWANSGTSTMWMLGIILYCALAIPPTLIAALGGRRSDRRRAKGA
jgi:hypothetical protein